MDVLMIVRSLMVVFEPCMHGQRIAAGGRACYYAFDHDGRSNAAVERSK
jgi:hypothetical protein